MKKTFEFDETFEASVNQVWEILKDPSSVVMEKITRFNKTNNLEWEEVPSNGVYNEYHATLDEDTHILHIVTKNSKYDSETNDIHIEVKVIDDTHSQVHVSYQIGTTAIFNIIAMEALGKQLIHHASNTIFKNISKQL